MPQVNPPLKAAKAMLVFVASQLRSENIRVLEAIDAGDDVNLILGTVDGVAQELRNVADNLEAAIRAARAAQKGA